MAVIWNNNKNDGQSASTITSYLCGVAGNFAASASTLNLSGFGTAILEGSKGYNNWAVGHEFTIEGDGTLYSITAMSNLSADSTTGDWSAGTITISPVLSGAARVGAAITKEDSYKGNQGSAENHIRLRRLGYI
tara:strand:- start:14639 stop:15040 length:402 start_codon:yes stop_codon:yes gene_type:complete